MSQLPDGPPHLLNERSWMIIYLCLNLGLVVLLKPYAAKYLDAARGEQRIDFRTHRRLKFALFAIVESIDCSWQIYGNVIFWHQYPKEVTTCKNEKNGGFAFCMLLFLIIGYIHFVFYGIFIGLFVFIKLRRIQDSRSQQQETRRLM